MSTISERIRKAACGERPKSPYIARWIGHPLQWKVIPTFKENDRPYFYEADEDTQRTFLLLVAEALS